MDTSDWIALVAVFMAFLALIFSGLSYAETKRTADANESMATSNKSMAEANKSMADSNKAMQVASEESARIARESLERQLESERDSKMARLRVTPGIRSVPGGSEHSLTFDVYNFGRHEAFTVGLTVEFEGEPYLTDSQNSIKPKESRPFRWTFDPEIIPAKPKHEFTIHLRFEDGLGRYTTTRRVVAFGDALVNWKINISNPEHGR